MKIQGYCVNACRSDCNVLYALSTVISKQELLHPRTNIVLKVRPLAYVDNIRTSQV